MQDLLKLKKIRITLWVVGELVLLLVVFGLGMAVGDHRSLFASRFGENYYHNFLGMGDGFGGRMEMGHFNTHGVAGTVIDVTSSTISVKNFRGSEESVAILPETIVSENDNTVSSTVITVGNDVIVVGQPDNQGEIRARFIRLFTSSSSMPLPPSSQ